MAGYPGGGREDRVPPLPDTTELTDTQQLEICSQALDQAEAHRRRKEFGAGIDLLVEALKYGHEKAAIYFRLGNLYFDTGDLGRAEYAYKRAIEVDPGHPSAHHNLGVLYHRQKKIAESVRYLKKASRLEAHRSRKFEFTPEERARLKRVAWQSLLFALAVLAALALVVFLISRLS